MVILDTDLVTLLETAKSKDSLRLRDRIVAVGSKNVATTVITYEEQMRGWLAYLARSRGVASEVNAYHRLSRHITYYSQIRVFPFDEHAAVTFQRLKSERIRIGTMDLRIASIALSLGLTLLSRNLRDFSQVPGLDVQDWSA